MSRSTLLHALSLNDRILEPNKLPLLGYVWAYEKSSMSKESFVGNCINLLWLLGSRDATFDWDNDIMAFDTRLNSQKATILISLQDDSLASDYYYFFGVWMAPAGGKGAKPFSFNGEIDWEEEDLSPPDIAFSVQVCDESLQLARIKQVIGGEVFAESSYDHSLNVYGSIEMTPRLSGSFVICPAMGGENQEGFEIRHALYSLRNLMALTGRVISIYDEIQQQNVAMQLSKELRKLMQEMDKDVVEMEAWDGLTRKSGEIALRTVSESIINHKKRLDVSSLLKLFEVIELELGVDEVGGISSLMARMKMPFDYATALIDEELSVMKAVDKQSDVLQAQMNNRILLSQQYVLNRLLDKI